MSLSYTSQAGRNSGLPTAAPQMGRIRNIEVPLSINSRIAFPITGDCMTHPDSRRSIPNGSVIQVRVIDHNDPFSYSPGVPYAFILKDGRRIVKNVVFGDFSDYFLPRLMLHANNPESEVKSFWLPLYKVHMAFEVEKVYPGGREEFERDQDRFSDAQEVDPIQ